MGGPCPTIITMPDSNLLVPSCTRVLKPDSFAVSFYGLPKADRFLTAFRAAGFRVVGHFVFPKRYTSKTQFVRYQHEAPYLLAKGNPKPHAIIG